jgi:hypothetical protein
VLGYKGRTLECLIDTARPADHAEACFLSVARNATGGGTEYLHRLITRCPKSLRVIHPNDNGLDNRWANLQKVTRSGVWLHRTCANANSSSGIYGVHKQGNAWEAKIGSRYLGYFQAKEDAAAAVERWLALQQARLRKGKKVKMPPEEVLPLPVHLRLLRWSRRTSSSCGGAATGLN